MISLKIPKGATRNHKSKRDRQHNGQKNKDKRTKGQTTSSYTTHKTKDRVTGTQLKTGDELICSRRVSSYCSVSNTCCVNLVTNPVISHE